ncbi:MAG: beta-lactamase family protein [Flavobacteriaceae bacterium]|nr:beta-lactamase family protein [Flavobacteriaceae bacterium]
MNKVILILIIALSLFGCNQEEKNQKLKEKQRSILNDSLTNKIDNAYAMGLLKGFSVAVVDEKDILYNKGFGFRDIDTTLLYTSSTVQPVGSVSKTLIGVSLIKAVELNLLKLKDPINKYLPFKVTNPNHPNTDILIEHLAYHTSSIIDVNEVYLGVYFLENNNKGEREGAYDFFKKSEEKISMEKYLANALDTNSAHYSKESFSLNKPGEKRQYSNIASDLCALIIQNASKKNFRDFTLEYIMKPLGMHSSGWKFEDIAHTEQSRLFAYKDMMISKYSESSYASGQFMTSSKDLALFLKELIRGYNGRGELLSKKGYNTLYAKKTFDQKSYGHFIEYTNNWLAIEDTIIGHNGADYGVFSGMYFNPERGTGKIMISNTDTDFYDNLDVWPETKKIWKSLMEYEKKVQRINTNR